MQRTVLCVSTVFFWTEVSSSLCSLSDDEDLMSVSYFAIPNIVCVKWKVCSLESLVRKHQNKYIFTPMNFLHLGSLLTGISNAAIQSSMSVKFYFTKGHTGKENHIKSQTLTVNLQAICFYKLKKSKLLNIFYYIVYLQLAFDIRPNKAQKKYIKMFSYHSIS